jgi:hypothetical protein
MFPLRHPDKVESTICSYPSDTANTGLNATPLPCLHVALGISFLTGIGSSTYAPTFISTTMRAPSYPLNGVPVHTFLGNNSFYRGSLNQATEK